MRNIPGKIAVVNDLCGYGRCSLAMMLPVISACGCQCCPVPTAVLSSSNDFPDPHLRELTGDLDGYTQHWKSLNLRFDGIYTGYLSSPEQMAPVEKFLREFRSDKTVVMVDPVFGDQGRISPRCTPEFLENYRRLICMADLITPNLTEALYLTGIPYDPCPPETVLDQAGKALLALGPASVVITGIHAGDESRTFLYTGEEKHVISVPYCPQERSGAGDMFASVLLPGYLGGMALEEAVRKAADFVSGALEYSRKLEIPASQGICFEPLLFRLCHKPNLRRNDPQ